VVGSELGLLVTFKRSPPVGGGVFQQDKAEIVLSFGLDALSFLVPEELLTEANEETEKLLLTLAFFAGFLLFLLLGMVA
jgi:zinc transporter ZupT